MYYILINDNFFGLTITKESLRTYSIDEMILDVLHYTGQLLSKDSIKTVKFIYQQ